MSSTSNVSPKGEAPQTLSVVLAGAKNNGFIHDFRFENGNLFCPGTGQTYTDKAIVSSVAIPCIHNMNVYTIVLADGLKGTMIDEA